MVRRNKLEVHRDDDIAFIARDGDEWIVTLIADATDKARSDLQQEMLRLGIPLDVTDHWYDLSQDRDVYILQTRTVDESS